MAKTNEKQQQQQITGFHLGGLIPLDRVGYVMAALYENSAQDLQVAPFAPDPRPQKTMRRVSDVSGVAGLLPAPAQNSAPVAPADRIQVLTEIVSAAPPEGLKKDVIVAALKEKGIHASVMDGSTLQGLVNDKILKRVGFGMYALGKGAVLKPSEPTPSQGAQVSAQDKPNNKRDAILLIVAKHGPEGVRRIDIQKQLADYGFQSGHFDQLPLMQLIDGGQVVRAGTGRYALAPNAAPTKAPPAKSPAPVADNGRQTLRSRILGYLHESAPQSRTQEQIVAKLAESSVGTKMSVGVELSQMFTKKIIARPTKGIYALLPE